MEGLNLFAPQEQLVLVRRQRKLISCPISFAAAPGLRWDGMAQCCVMSWDAILSLSQSVESGMKTWK